jgi:uncharacterized membrane protein
MITIEYVYVLTGLMLVAFAVLSLRDRTNPKRVGNAAFWGVLALAFLFGSHLSDFWNGILALALIVIGGFDLMHKGAAPTVTHEERMTSAVKRGNRLFLPALVVPFIALAGTLLLKNSGLVDPKQVTIISLSLGV